MALETSFRLPYGSAEHTRRYTHTMIVPDVQVFREPVPPLLL